jgi:hypothetical protein
MSASSARNGESLANLPAISSSTPLPPISGSPIVLVLVIVVVLGLPFPFRDPQ